jgi:hypothetical protein
MDDRIIYTSTDDPIYWFNGDVDDYLDKTIMIFGGTGSGKTTIIESVLKSVSKYIPNYIAIVPKTSNKAYVSKLPSLCIKEDLTKDTIEKIWDRQQHITQLYEIANDIDTLASLFRKYPDRQVHIMIRAILERAASKLQSIQECNLDHAKKKSQTIHIDELRNKKIKALYKKSIRQHRAKLETMDLNDKERVALIYLDINPRLMLIIDDSSEKFAIWMKYFKKSEINPFEAILYRGRHNYITLVIAAHDDKLVATELRKNARVTYYCNSTALMASLNKQQSGFTSADKKHAQKIATEVFSSEDNGIKTYKKMCYIREDCRPWRYHIADLYPEFPLGCDPLIELVKKMPTVSTNLADNPFLKNIVGSQNKPKKRHQPRYAKGGNKKKY